jgi:rare lipoprotein A
MKFLKPTKSKIYCLLLLLSCFNFVHAQKKLVSVDTSKIDNKQNRKTLYGQASFYSTKFEGRKTANGEIFSHKKLTAACNSLPLGTWIQVTNLRNGKSVTVKTNDRLHPNTKRLVDLTMAGARKLDFVSAGLTRVKVLVLGKHYKNK